MSLALKPEAPERPRSPSALWALAAYVHREVSGHGWLALWRKFTLWCGVLWRWAPHREMVRVMSAPGTQMARAAFPRLEYRYTLPYLSLHFGRAARYDMLKTHYSLVNQRLVPAFMQTVVDGGLCLWRSEAEGQALQVRLKGLCLQTRHSEGELTLEFNVDGVGVYNLSFALIRSVSVQPTEPVLAGRSEYAAYVGRVQGVPGQYELIRHVTKSCGEVAPPDMLMAAAAGLLAALGIDTMVGVDKESSISHETIRRSGTTFEYAAFWTRYQAAFLEGGHALITLPFVEKPITDIPSRHRKRTLFKRELKKGLADQVQQVVQTYLVRR
jgi:uncharacterized protein VirK/YbjX